MFTAQLAAKHTKYLHNAFKHSLQNTLLSERRAYKDFLSYCVEPQTDFLQKDIFILVHTVWLLFFTVCRKHFCRRVLLVRPSTPGSGPPGVKAQTHGDQQVWEKLQKQKQAAGFQ